MKLSDLIARLQKIMVARGDVDVEVWDDWDHFPVTHLSWNPEQSSIVIQGEHGGWSREDDA